MPKAYLYDLTDTWNAGGTTFTAIKMNVTDSASAAGSLLLNLQVGGATQFSVSKAGTTVALGSVQSTFGNFSTASATGQFSLNGEIFLARDAADTLAQRRSTNAQTFRIYNTYTDASNYERGVFDFKTNTNELVIGTEKAGSGTTLPIRIKIGGTAYWQYSTAGHLFAFTDNQVDIGASGANRPRDLFVARNVFVSSYVQSSSFRLGTGSGYAFADNDSTTWRLGLSSSFTEGQIFSAGGNLALSLTANVIEQRNSTTAQAFRVYNTFTDASNYERGFMRWSSNIFEIGAEALGTGSGRQVHIQAPTSTAVVLRVGSTSTVTVNNDRCLFDNSAFFGFSDIRIYRAAANILNFGAGSSTTGSALQMQEMTAPAAPATDGVRIYAEDNGSGKTRLMALFATGAAVQIAIEP